MCLISVSYNTVLLTGVTEILCGLLCKQLVPCNMSVTVFPSLKFSCLFAITENNQPFYIPKGFHSLSQFGHVNYMSVGGLRKTKTQHVYFLHLMCFCQEILTLFLIRVLFFISLTKCMLRQSSYFNTNTHNVFSLCGCIVYIFKKFHSITLGLSVKELVIFLAHENVLWFSC